MSQCTWIGIDIGGANLKAATSDGRVASQSFALWKHPEQLERELARLLDRLQPFDAAAVTMTGELADCYRDSCEGVRRIVSATERCVRGTPTAYFAADGRFVSHHDAVRLPELIAAANWRASAQWLAPHYPHGRSLLIDIGSTTCDLTLLEEGKIASTSRTDFDRLSRGELIYLGAERTPVCSLVNCLPIRGQEVPVMREVFATIADCAVLMELVPENRAAYHTADGRPQTIAAALNRMARMVGLDHRSIGLADAQTMAERVVAEARCIVAAAIEAFGPCDRWIALGHGTWLLPQEPPCPVEQPAFSTSPQAARVGPAYALAMLAAEQDPLLAST